MDELILPFDAFVRAVGVNRGTPHAVFLGAGTSITSGIPSAWGVVCPDAESQVLETYLHQCERRHQPHQTEQDYLLEYPGFAPAFGVPIALPQPGSEGWAICPEPSANADFKEGALECARLLTQAIASLDATCKPNVVLVFIPARWRRWSRFETDDERFDLHDFVKAYCVQRGVATQFLEEDTLANPYRCRVWWWLSLALYAKAMRTPWVLDSLEPDTAFVGLGFSVDRAAETGQHIVLGCSHLYNAQGQGLQYRLSKIEDPILVRGNCFMSRDDARRVGETIRQLFFDSQSTLPRRVVIHKLTPFRKESLARPCKSCSLPTWKKPSRFWTTNFCRRLPMPWNAATAVTAKCKRPSTECVPNRISPRGSPWTCSGRSEASSASKPLRRCTPLVLDKPPDPQ